MQMLVTKTPMLMRMLKRIEMVVVVMMMMGDVDVDDEWFC